MTANSNKTKKTRSMKHFHDNDGDVRISELTADTLCKELTIDKIEIFAIGLQNYLSFNMIPMPMAIEWLLQTKPSMTCQLLDMIETKQTDRSYTTACTHSFAHSI